MKIALYYRHIAPADQPALEQLVERLHRSGIATVTVADGDSMAGFDYLFSIGGDGTLLSAVQLLTRSGNQPFRPSDIPILGINFGHLGFLTTAGKANLDRLVDDLLESRFSLEERTLLSVKHSENQASNQIALNEAFVHRGEAVSLLRTHVYVDGLYVATYAGDGVIVATPTGSTAYSLSCGGPILTPDSSSLVITPISAHTLTLRPIIVPDTSHLELRVDSDQPFTLGIDSRRTLLQGPASFSIARAPFTIRLIRLDTQNFFSAIRDKLMWGTEVRQ